MHTTTFWAKLEHHEGQLVGWHSVVDHCADVAACGEALLSHTLLGARLARLGGAAELLPQQIARLGVLLALHDFGKFNLGFQNKELPEGQRPFSAGHLAEALGPLVTRRQGYEHIQSGLNKALALRELLGWVENEDDEVLLQLLVATISHHGRPVGPSTDFKECLWTADGSRDPIAAVAELVERTRGWFPLAWEAGGAPLPGSPAFQHGWCGLVMLADWLGSDTRHFPLAHGLVADRMPEARRRAREVLHHLALETGPLRQELGEVPPGYERIAPRFSPRPVQARILDPEKRGKTAGPCSGPLF